MNMNLNPYAVIISVGLGIMLMISLRNPIFALFISLLSIIILDMGFKAVEERKKK